MSRINNSSPFVEEKKKRGEYPRLKIPKSTSTSDLRVDYSSQRQRFRIKTGNAKHLNSYILSNNKKKIFIEEKRPPLYLSKEKDQLRNIGSVGAICY